MNYPIQGDQLTVEMLRGVYQFDDETLYQRFIYDYEDISFESMDDAEAEMESYEIDMQVHDSLEDGYDEYYNDNEDNGFDGFVRPLLDEIIVKATMFKQRRIFKYTIHQDLIVAAMHPNRIQKQLDQFDDIEAYFDAIGC
jgi:hypothetical protein